VQADRVVEYGHPYGADTVRDALAQFGNGRWRVVNRDAEPGPATARRRTGLVCPPMQFVANSCDLPPGPIFFLEPADGLEQQPAHAVLRG